MNITNPSFYVNDLHIPQAIAQPSIQSNTPTANAQLVDCITYVERRILLNALGLVQYNELQEALETRVEPADNWDVDQKWKDLVNGLEYDGKIWEGLASAKSLLCYAVYCEFLDENSAYWSTMGITKPESENAANVTPVFKLASASQKFVRKYQGGACGHPFRDFGIGYSYTDYYGSELEVEVSLYQFLRDHSNLYAFDTFKTYEPLNSFGL